MSDKKSLAGKQQPNDSAGARRHKRSNEAAETPRGEAAAGKATDRTVNAAAGDAGFLSAEDLKHFREVFKNKVSPPQQIVEADQALPGLSAPEAEPVTETRSPGRKRRGRGPQKSPTKVLTSIRLDKEVYEYFRDSGRGWQSRINEFLTEKMQRERRGKRRKANADDKASAANKSA